MNPIRLIFGLLLVYFCIFGLPEGCLVMPSHAASPAPASCNTDPADEIPPEWIGPKPLQEVPHTVPSQADRLLPTGC